MDSRTEGNRDGNNSTECPEGKGTKSRVITGVGIVLSYHLQETSFTKEAHRKYTKDDMKPVKRKLRNRDLKE